MLPTGSQPPGISEGSTRLGDPAVRPSRGIVKTKGLHESGVEGQRDRDASYRPWKGQPFPEKLEVRKSLVSEASILGCWSPFLVGAPMRIEGEVRNTGGTPMPSEGPRGPGYYWELVINIRWGDGQTTRLPITYTEPLQPGDGVPFGPLRPKVVAPGP